MKGEPDFLQNLRNEMGGGRQWLDRAIVITFAVLAGLAVVGFTLLADTAFEWFDALRSAAWWAPLLWTPAVTALVVWGIVRIVGVPTNLSAGQKKALLKIGLLAGLAWWWATGHLAPLLALGRGDLEAEWSGELAQEGGPEGLCLRGADHEPAHLAPSVSVDGDRHDHGHRDDAALLAHLDVGGV